MSSSKNDFKIIAFVGMPGAGKTSAVDHLKSKHYPAVYFGGVVLSAMTKAGLEHTQKNEQVFREELRAKEGNDFIVKHIIEQLHDLIDAGQKRIVADGLYTWDEYKILKREFPQELLVVAIVAPRRLRYKRLSKRPRRPLSHAEAHNRDWAEIENLKKGGPIAIADHFIVNDGDLDDLHQKIDDLLEQEQFCKTAEQCSD